MAYPFPATWAVQTGVRPGACVAPVMCGRFSTADPARIAARFARFVFPSGLKTSYNVAPTQLVPALCNDRGNRVEMLHWGLLPPWSRDKSIASRTINARSETVAEKPMFRGAFRHRRCLVFADGYYEWLRGGGQKRPFRFTVDGGEPFAFAGIWESRLEEEEEVRSVSILTTSPNAVQAAIHDRMPVILDPTAFDLWLATDDVPIEIVQSVCVPFPASRMSATEVSTLVNNVKNDTAACLEPPAPPLTLL